MTATQADGGTDKSRLRPGRASAAPSALLIDAVSGPHTIVGIGEDCFVCGDPLEPGEVYLFVSDVERNGVAHEACTDNRDPLPMQ